jgi:hypothetical protein
LAKSSSLLWLKFNWFFQKCRLFAAKVVWQLGFLWEELQIRFFLRNKNQNFYPKTFLLWEHLISLWDFIIFLSHCLIFLLAMRYGTVLLLFVQFWYHKDSVTQPMKFLESKIQNLFLEKIPESVKGVMMWISHWV